VLVTLTFNDSTLVEVRFSSEIDGNTIESTTTLAPLTDTTPVSAPTG
jgi:hypothetical protein